MSRNLDESSGQVSWVRSDDLFASGPSFPEIVGGRDVEQPIGDRIMCSRRRNTSRPKHGPCHGTRNIFNRVSEE